MASSRGVTASCATASNDPATREEAPLPMNFRWFLAAPLLLLLCSGNFISLDLGHGRFATYEHLRPGSITVAKGDHVRVGQVIAEVGFSGDSTEPHLHFHVSDSAMPLEGEGLPYALDRFRVVGRVTDWNAFGSQRWTARRASSSTRFRHQAT